MRVAWKMGSWVVGVGIAMALVSCESRVVPDEAPGLSGEAAGEAEAEEGDGPVGTSGYELVRRADEDGMDWEYVLVDGEGVAVELPGQTAEELRTSRPVLLQERYVVYDRPRRSDYSQFQELVAYDLHVDEEILLDRFDMRTVDFFDFGAASPSENHVLSVAGNQGFDNMDQWAGINVYTLEEGALTALRRSTNIDPHVRCAARCYTADVGFRDEETVYYLEQASEPEPAEEDQVLVEIALVEMSSLTEIDRASPLAEICRGHEVCHEVRRVELEGPRTAGGAWIEVALHDHGEEGRRRREPCALFEHWYVDGDGRATRLVETCNDGYGARGMGEDEVELDGEELVHWQAGGSNWMWSRTTRIDLGDLRVVEEDLTGTFAMGPNAERRTIRWDDFSGFVHWKAPHCDAEDLHEPDLDLHDLDNTEAPTYRYDLIPQVAVPEGFSQELWRTTGLGSCATEVDSAAHTGDVTGQGFVIHGEPGGPEDARFRAVMGSPTELYVEIVDVDWNFENDSWLYQDHLEIWATSERYNYHSHCIEPSEPSQWGVSLTDGAVYGAHGSPDPDALRVEVARDSDNGAEVIRARIEFAEEPEGLTVVYSDSFTGERQDRMIATSDVRFGDAVTLGRPFVIEAGVGRCVIEEGRLRFDDLRRAGESSTW